MLFTFPRVQNCVDWSKGDRTYRFLLSALMVGHQIEKEPLNHWKGTSHSVFVISTIDHPGICSWHALILCTACWFRFSPSYSIPLSRMVYHFVVLSLQFFASCIAWDPSFPEVYAWQGAWKAFALDLPTIDPPAFLISIIVLYCHFRFPRHHLC